MRNRRMLLVGILTLFCLAPALSVMADAAGNAAATTVANEIGRILAGSSRYVQALGSNSDYASDLRKILAAHRQTAAAKPMLLGGKVVKWLVPLVLDANTIGGFFQVSADGKTIISYMPWDAARKPVFVLPKAKWEQAHTANDLPELAELLPTKETPSAGIPVEPADIENLYLIDFVDRIPSKTQEERQAFVTEASLKATLGRRTASSKCLSYAAAINSDWWKTALGLPIGKYVSFVNGLMEYGMNPRLVESIYFATPASPYTFKKLAGKDRVTGEKIPYSPKHYAYIMSWLKPPATIKDPLKPAIVHQMPETGFGMDRPFFTVFDKSRGNVADITRDLKRFGILYGQHTSRLFSDKVSLTLQGVHAVNIVGTGRHQGKDVVLYYETFGKNHRDYLEDSMYGPRLRAFPVKFFYQGIAFPHQIRVRHKSANGRFEFQLSDHLGRALRPDQMQVWLNGKIQASSGDGRGQLALPAAPAEIRLTFRKTYFQTPEEPDQYERIFLVAGSTVLEFREYEAVVAGLSEHRKGISLFDRSCASLGDYLQRREEQLREQLLQNLKAKSSDHALLAAAARLVGNRPTLSASALGKGVLALARFQKLTN